MNLAIWHTLRNKLIVVFLLVALCPLMILAWVHDWSAREVLRDTARQSLLVAASQTAASIDAFIEANLNAVRVEALLPALIDCLAYISPAHICPDYQQRTRSTLVSLSRKDTVNVLSYALLDMNGYNVIDTYTANMGQREADQHYFQQPLQSGLPYASSMQLADDLGRLATVHFSSVVRNAHGQPIGVLRVRYNATVIQQLVMAHTGATGAESFALLLDEHDVFLAHGFRPDLTFQAAMPLEPDMAARLQRQRRISMRYSGPGDAANLKSFAEGLRHADRKPYFSAPLFPSDPNRRNQVAVVSLQTLPWRVAFTQPQHTLLKLVEAQSHQTLWVASLMALLVMIVAIAISQLLVRELVALSKAVSRFAEGDPNVRIDVKTHDEIGGLAHAFNQMMARIRAYTVNLESLVAERTNALQEEIKERQQIEVELRQAKEDAEAANRAKSEFLAHMSHELRTPLNAILGFNQLLSHDHTLRAQQRQYLNTINRSGEHLLVLINDVLEMSKIDAGQVVLHESAFDLHEGLDNLQQMLRLRAEKKGLELVFELDRDVPRYIVTDEGKLYQVLTNLLGNAIKFTDRGQVTLRAKGQALPDVVETRAETCCLTFEVEDTGPGIAPDEMNHLFKAFVQTRSGRMAQEGTGLGLAISQKFIQLMGGDITVHSRLGAGSRFGFSIPVTIAQQARRTDCLADGRRIRGLEPGQPECRILVADDLDDNRRILVDMLEPMGFHVKEARDGAEAMHICRQWQPHAIWMDVRMPNIDGLEATRRIKAMTASAPP